MRRLLRRKLQRNEKKDRRRKLIKRKRKEIKTSRRKRVRVKMIVNQTMKGEQKMINLRKQKKRRLYLRRFLKKMIH